MEEINLPSGIYCRHNSLGVFLEKVAVYKGY
jgi:hypothetical protein